MKETNWDEAISYSLIGLFVLFILGMSAYAMQSMTPDEKDTFILQMQSFQLYQ
jgi:hypothetical protein